MLSKRLSILREARGKTQKQVASELGLTYQRYNHYETGKRQPDNDTLKILAEYFNVTTDYLLGRPEKAEPDIVAFHKNTSDGFTDEEREEIDNFIEYIISKRDKE